MENTFVPLNTGFGLPATGGERLLEGGLFLLTPCPDSAPHYCNGRPILPQDRSHIRPQARHGERCGPTIRTLDTERFRHCLLFSIRDDTRNIATVRHPGFVRAHTRTTGYCARPFMLVSKLNQMSQNCTALDEHRVPFLF